MTSAKSITLAQFQDALRRYPAVIKTFSDAENPSSVTLESLDQFRYIDAPASFSKQTGNVLKAEDIQRLTAWKLRHGKYRPSLSKLVASNTNETISEATTTAFKHYASNPSDITGTLKLLAEPLRGVGPATASLYLSVHDPSNIIFFSDEAYKWLLDDRKLKYDLKEYEELNKATKAFISKFSSVTPIEVEKVAFVIIKEAEPVREKSTPYVKTGKPRGRPANPDGQKKKPSPVPGRGRGRPAKQVTASKETSEETSDAPAKKRGRPPGAKKTEAEAVENDSPAAHVPAHLVSSPSNKRTKRPPPGASKTDGPSAKRAKA